MLRAPDKVQQATGLMHRRAGAHLSQANRLAGPPLGPGSTVQRVALHRVRDTEPMYCREVVFNRVER
ncbi:hypothetical protein CH341_25180 [Rhodoplanes roseus]|uniref:Uncharacterized protein n=1 Tax=Rhodoplanes roseus TaxID=29409 RepID=A0A327KPE8_9BRAD|nr:hypothetical protein CH341_25180 [Rhodoplanes roseus]